VIQIYTGIYCLKGCIGRIALLISADDIITHTERKYLLVMEDVLNHDNRTAAFLIRLLVRMLVFLTLTQFADTNANTEFLTTVRALEYQ
jgi:hypothetical protein